jgi:hypothetical protein
MGIFRNSQPPQSVENDPSTRKIDRDSDDFFNLQFPESGTQNAGIDSLLPTHSVQDNHASEHTTIESTEEEPKTRVFYKRNVDSNSSMTAAEASIMQSNTNNPMDDPVVGWLVIVDGKGKGNSLSLGYGMNSIGSGQSERICLTFGDSSVSRTKHALITYDPRGRRFYAQHGGGKNLTYLVSDPNSTPIPLLTPVELQGGEQIIVGETTLRFVPLCGQDFDWQL